MENRRSGKCLDSRSLRKVPRCARKPGDPLVELLESLVVRLPARVAEINLLKHHRYFEQREHLIERDARKITPGLLSIALDDLLPADPPRLGRDRAYRFAARLGIVLLSPVAQEDSNVDQRIADSAHLPIEHRYYAGRVGRIEHRVVELEIVVHERCWPSRFRSGLRRNTVGEPLNDLIDFAQLVCLRAVPSLGPALHLAGDEPNRLSEVHDPRRIDVNRVQRSEGVDHAFADPPPQIEIITDFFWRLAS